MARTLLYGGTFDPIHLGHLITAQSALEQLHAERLLFLPARVSPHKLTHTTASAHHRLEMLRLATAHHPQFAVSDLELNRPGPSFTIDTIEALTPAIPEMTLLIGADQLAQFHTWHRITHLLATVDLAVLRRPGITLPTPQELSRNFTPAQASKILTAVIATPLIEISATDIRNRVQNGLPIDFYVTPEIFRYITSERLYHSPR